MVKIRPTTANDRLTTRKMVLHERLDPTSLNWRNFLIAEQDGQIIGIGQIKSYPGCRELGSLVVLKSYKKQGIASRLITALEDQSSYPLYLLCGSHLEAFYSRFGYQVIAWRNAPTALKLKLIPTLLFRLFGIHVLVMQKLRRGGMGI
jgi:amino-acid N-acetyltransferase